MRKGEELKTPRHANAAALRNDRLPNSRQKQKLDKRSIVGYILLFIA